MSLADPNTIDYLGLEKDSGCVVLTLVDDCDWVDELQHLALLQGKINRYFDFIESGEIFNRLREVIDRSVISATPVKISVLASYVPTTEGQRFLDYVAQVAKDVNVRFSFKVLPK